jgi:hypothetical protein
MVVFLFVTACVALLVGLVALVVGHMPGRMGCKRAIRAAASARQQGST